MSAVPAGTICLWHGAIVDIPTGWILCNGANGTPDLRDRFIVCAGGAFAVGAAGGNQTHTHTFTGDGHNHDFTAGFGIASGAVYDNTTSTDPARGTTDSGNHLPPYHALAYIMRT